MPLYEYQCTSCGERSETIQKFSDDPLTDCQSCGGPLKRLLSAPAIRFKGSGWYLTDYAKKASGEESAKADAPEKGEKPEKAAKSEKAESKADSASKESPVSTGGSKPGGAKSES